MRAGVVQMRSTTSIAENCTAMEEMVRAAAANGAQYVQTPEMTGILQKSRRHLFSEIKSQDQDDLVRRASELAAALGIWLHIGSHAIKLNEDKAANRAFLFAPNGELAAYYDKIHMFDVDLDNGESWRESKVYQPGARSCMVDLGEALLGLSICYDVRFPHLYREQALAGAQILTAPAAFTRQTGKAHWHILMKSRAIENGAFLIAAAQGGDHDDGRETFGHSLVVNPWGEIIAEIASEEPGYLTVDLDLDEVTKARRKIPNLANTRAFVLERPSGKIEVAS
ncbi:MAG: carbon-nitrogen hydrolase family protein [Pseudomonadota bacterium]